MSKSPLGMSLEDLQSDQDYVDERERQECENEFGKDDWEPLPKEAPKGQNSRSELSNRTWSRKSSPNRGEYLKMDDELMTISRGGTRMTLVKSTAHHAPTITIGQLDDAGRDILDEKLRGSSTIEEIVEFFRHYLPQSGIKLDIVKSRSVEKENGILEEPTEIGKKTSKTTNQNEKLDANSMNTKKPTFGDHDAQKSNDVGNDTTAGQNNIINQNDNGGKNDNDRKNNYDGNNVQDGNKTDNMSNNLPTIKIEDHSKNNKKEEEDENDKAKVKNEGHEKKETKVFDILEADYLKRMIPYMHPSSKKHTFRFFIDRVHEVCDGKGLLETDVLDVMQFRMGGSYLAEIKDLRIKKWELVCIEEFYLQKDLDYENEKRKKGKLLEESRKVEEYVEMLRKKQKDAWGFTISYSKNSESGLLLVLGHVEEDSPAWRCGLRAGDAIVTVNEWVITLMDRPEVAVHLLQASANSVKLGIVKCDVRFDECHAVGIF